MSIEGVKNVEELAVVSSPRFLVAVMDSSTGKMALQLAWTDKDWELCMEAVILKALQEMPNHDGNGRSNAGKLFLC